MFHGVAPRGQQFYSLPPCQSHPVKHRWKRTDISLQPHLHQHQGELRQARPTPDNPQSEIAATNFYDSGGRLGEELREELGGNLDEIFWALNAIFVLHLPGRTTHQNFSPKSSQSITLCLVTTPVAEISKHHLHEFLGLGATNFSSGCFCEQDDGTTGGPDKRRTSHAPLASPSLVAH